MEMDRVSEFPLWLAGGFSVLGLLFAFAGYRLLRLTARLQCALLFFAIGAAVAIPYSIEYFSTPWVGLGAGVVLGFVGYMLGDAYYFLNILVIGAAGGFALGAAATGSVTGEPDVFGGLIGLVVGGIMSFYLERHVGILGTASLGAFLFTMGALVFVAVNPSINENVPSWVGMAIVASFFSLGILGSVVQYKTTRNLPDRSDDSKRNTKARTA